MYFVTKQMADTWHDSSESDIERIHCLQVINSFTEHHHHTTASWMNGNSHHVTLKRCGDLEFDSTWSGGLLQSGLTLLGDATTMPAFAPEAQAPSAPILHKIPARAIGLSMAMKASIVRSKRRDSRFSTRPGARKARMLCQARLPTIMSEVKE